MSKETEKSTNTKNTAATLADDENKLSQEKLLASIDQLTQVLEILGKLTTRIKQQVEHLPKTYPNKAISKTSKTKAKTVADKADKVFH